MLLTPPESYPGKSDDEGRQTALGIISSKSHNNTVVIISSFFFLEPDDFRGESGELLTCE